MTIKTIIHLLSGGLDSVTMLYDLFEQGHNIHCLLVDYKQPHVQELTFARGHCRRLEVLWTTMEIPPLGGMKKDNWIVPNRNAILISLAVNLAVEAKADTVTFGANMDDAEIFMDCSPQFVAAMNECVKAAGYHGIEVCAPYITWPKQKIGGLAMQMGIPIHEIWSCYVGGAKPCGKCLACQKLKAALP